jgi:hypothetical protein
MVSTMSSTISMSKIKLKKNYYKKKKNKTPRQSHIHTSCSVSQYPSPCWPVIRAVLKVHNHGSQKKKKTPNEQPGSNKITTVLTNLKLLNRVNGHKFMYYYYIILYYIYLL